MTVFFITNKYFKDINIYMINSNSYAENLKKLTESSADIIAIASGINEAMAGNDAEVNISEDMSLPSFSNIVKRVERAENTISKFTQGKGVVETDDGTYRKIKVTNVSRPPEAISSLTFSNVFSIDPNWFFESLQYPRCTVSIDLTDKIDEDSDRVYVARIILDRSNTDILDYYNTNIANKPVGYAALITMLEKDGITYKEDKDEIKLPLTYEKYYGEFRIVNTKLIQDNKGVSRLWYFLDTLSYSEVNEAGIAVSTGNILSVNDKVRFNNSLYSVLEVDQSQNCVRLGYDIGYETLGNGDILEFYNAPFSSKVVNIGIGINEIDIVYVKGINEEYNLIAKDWSNPISFITNDLVFDGNANITFEEYYSKNVADFGKSWIAQIKEGQIHAYNGSTPRAPVINVDDLQVVQINTQLDATLDKETYNKLTSEIAQTKSNISAVRTTIATNKDLLIQSSDEDVRKNIQNIINSDTETLNSLTTQYNSLVEELNTLLNETGVINYSPKYHIRGFFAIPEPVNEQQVIGFDIMYRYLHTDETGIKLNTYEYTDSNDIVQTGVFTDWNIVESSLLEKVFDVENDRFIWKNESSADGSKININQIDIPIRNGEKVEIKVRSISEAGYPSNPLKSSWSQSVIISFPDNLTSDDTVTTILDSVKSDMTAVVLQETMSAAGVYTHLADGNSTYKHTAKNISYTDSSTDENSVTTLTEMSLQDKVDALSKLIVDARKSFDTEVKTLKETVNNSINDIKAIIGYTKDSYGEYTVKPEYLENNDNLSTVIDAITQTLNTVKTTLNI